MMLAVLILSSVVLTNASEVADAVMRFRTNVEFRLTGTVSSPCLGKRNYLLLEDASGYTQLMNLSPGWKTFGLSAGDVISTHGATEMSVLGYVHASCSNICVVSHAAPPTPVDATIREIKRGDFDFRLVRTRGTVREAFRDEIDPDWHYLILESDNDALYIQLFTSGTKLDPKVLVNADISVCGACSLFTCGSRQWIGRTIVLQTPSAISITNPAPTDPFDVPFFDSNLRLNPENISQIRCRRMAGTVLATWHGNRALVKDDTGGIHAIELSDGMTPRVGQCIETVGHPETDLFRINLSNAIWRPSKGAPVSPSAPLPLGAKTVFLDGNGEQRIDQRLHGRAIRMVGILQDIPIWSEKPKAFSLKSDGFTIPVELGDSFDSLPALFCVGSTVEITGICVLETANWTSYSAFPHTTGITLVVNRPDDLRLISRPSWWTPARLTSVIGALVVLLISIFIWNRFLQRLVEKRSRQLFRAEVDRVGSELRVEERTRLAVELHDSISQNLTGASMQIDAAERLLDRDRDKTLQHLEIASRTLTSCREDLRNCIWDLRSQALEERDMNEAIRRTVRQHAEGVDLSIRFNVPRERLSDNTAHALLRIIRELVTNAVRHGDARRIRIAGTIDRGTLLFSVADDGRGFDPHHHPDMAQGHFGLQGIRERIRQLQGTIAIDSGHEQGTKVSISIPTRMEGQENDG